MNVRYYIGVDVGTGSARAGIFDSRGQMLAEGRHDIQTWEPEIDFAEQSSQDIWSACTGAVSECIDRADVRPARVHGIGFDATCSLVVVDETGAPITISPTGEPRRNVILWMDHRAVDEAERINRTEHAVLEYVGGRISPEMEPPKLLWLREHLPDTWDRAAHFFDLADYLVFRATGATVRSLCTTVCKWTYRGHEASGYGTGGWADDFWREIGLGDLVEEEFQRIGRRIRPPGEEVGGLSARAAGELGLRAGTPVAVPVIDAHAGGIGLLGTPGPGGVEEHDRDPLNRRVALIGGTSSCHMAVSSEPRFIEGVWGPYYSAMVPGMWLTEGGQSATGALIDHVIFSHARSRELQQKARDRNTTVYECLNDILEDLGRSHPFPARLTREMHVLPYFHGNRSPRADASLRGMISGLRLSDALDELAVLYLATIQAVAHGTRHIIDEMNQAGYEIDTIAAAGGGTRNPVFLREHADITGCRVLLPGESEAVLLGSAMLGAVAGGEYPSVAAAMRGMSRRGSIIEPAGVEVRAYHDAKHRVFRSMYEHQIHYRDLMCRGD